MRCRQPWGKGSSQSPMHCIKACDQQRAVLHETQYLKLLHSLSPGNASSLLSCICEALQVCHPYEALQKEPVAIRQA